MSAKPTTINLYMVLKDPGAVLLMKKDENSHDFALDYLTAGEEKIKLDVAVGMYEIIEEGNFEHPIGAKNWMKEYGLPENTYCMNNATATTTGFMTGFFAIYYATTELLSVITSDSVAAQTFFTWFEDTCKKYINLYKTTGFTYTNTYGKEVIAVIPKGVTMTNGKNGNETGKTEVR